MTSADRPAGAAAVRCQVGCGRERANGSDDVPAISDVAVRAFGVVRTADKLLVRFRDHEGGGPQEIELSWFARRPELAEPLADYLAKWGSGQSPGNPGRASEKTPAVLAFP